MSMTDNFNKKRQDKYWICDECVKSKYPDWKSAYPNGGNTLILGLCGHCDRLDETGLTPIRDFKKPGERTRLWD